MANRVLFGNRDSTMGLWVSKPGFDVITTSPGNLLLGSNQMLNGFAATGTFIVPPSTTGEVHTYPLPDLGGQIPIGIIFWKMVVDDKVYIGNTPQQGEFGSSGYGYSFTPTEIEFVVPYETSETASYHYLCYGAQA